MEGDAVPDRDAERGAAEFLAEIEEGNLAMLILRTADNLRHIRSLGRVFPSAAATAARGIESILRDPVVTFYEN